LQVTFFFKARLILQLIFWLFFIRMLMVFSSFNTITSHIGTRQFKPSINRQQIKAKKEVCVFLRKSVRRVAFILPFKCKCLSQAYAVARILQRYKLPYTVYFGVAKDEKKHFKAHAWLKVGGRAIAGGKRHAHFQTFQYFGWQYS
jgi:hypothetical protein